MLLEGLRLMAVGMVTVFVFLSLLVGLMQGSAAFFAAFAHRFPDADLDDPSIDESGADVEVAIAIAAAEASRRGQGI
jgi:sodium pump decarboxylase gamma subunit